MHRVLNFHTVSRRPEGDSPRVGRHDRLLAIGTEGRCRSPWNTMSTGYADPYSVKVTSGILVTCDSAAKQLLLHIDSSRDGPDKFILRDVDETHVMIKKDTEEEVIDLLQTELEKNTYVQDPDM